jgi:hypothetical protein
MDGWELNESVPAQTRIKPFMNWCACDRSGLQAVSTPSTIGERSETACFGNDI